MPELPGGPATADDVRRAAASAPDLAELAVRARSCTACPELAATRTQVVVGQVPPGARLLVMGEAPGATEDASGEPFVGRSGQLLDELLADVGVPRPEVAVLNTVKCRPPGNRTPSRAESAACRPWAERQLELAAPAVVVALGLSATRWFLGPTSLTAVRGRLHEVGGPAGTALQGTLEGDPDRPGYQVLPTYHPSAALRWGPAGEPRRLLREDLATAARAAGCPGSAHPELPGG